MKIPLSVLLSLVLPLVADAADAVRSAAGLLPPETFVLGELHDVKRSAERLGQSSWGELAKEPEVRGMLDKVFAAVKQEIPPQAIEMLAGIEKLELSSAFFSLTETPDFRPGPSGVPKMLFGASYRGKKEQMDAMLQRLREGMFANPRVKKSEEMGSGVEIESFADSDFTFHIAHAEGQVLFATDRQTMLDALARRAGKGSRSLADTAMWKSAEKQALPDADVSGFFSYEAFMAKLMASAGRDAAMFEGLQDFIPTFISFSTKLDGPLMRERFYTGMKKPYQFAESKHRSLAFTGEDTFFYLDSAMLSNWGPYMKMAQNAPFWRAIAVELGKRELTFDDIVQAIGSEMTIVSDWETGPLAIPTLFAAVEVRDAAKARKIADVIVREMEKEGAITEKEHAGANLWTMKGAIPLVQPTIALSKTHLMFGLNVGSVTAALDHAATGKSALADSDVFKNGLKTVEKTDAGMMFLDMARVTERLYDRVRPFIANEIAGSPKLSGILGSSELPKVATIAKHMPPLIAGFHNEEGGFLMESTGPLSYFSGAVGMGFVGGFLFAFENKRVEMVPPMPIPNNGPI